MSDVPIPREKLLLLQVSEGNETAFNELVSQYFPIVYNYIYKITDDRVMTEEIVQDVFLKLWLARETLTQVSNFGGYLFVVSRNFALEALKKMLKARSQRVEWERHMMRTGDDESIKHYGNLMEEAISRLSAQQQKAWMLNRQLRLSYEETAREMDVSKETVKKYLQIASASVLQFLRTRSGLLCLVAFYDWIRD